MPIYEFKCLKCHECFELLIMNKNKEVQLKCPECNSKEFERVLSQAGYSMGNSSGKNKGITSQTSTCSGGTCTTYDIPGPDR